MRKLSASRGNSIDPASRAGPATPEKSRLPDRLNRNPSRQPITNLASVRKGTIVREKYDPLYAKLSPISNRKPRRGRKAWIRKRGFSASHSRLPQRAQKRFDLPQAASFRTTATPPDIMGRYSAFESARSREDDKPSQNISFPGWLDARLRGHDTWELAPLITTRICDRYCGYQNQGDGSGI